MAGCDPSANSGQVREQADLLPEYIHYQDSGCEVAPACLRCPLVRCQYDPDLAGRRGWLRRSERGQRDLEIAAVYRGQRPAIRELARRFGVSIRTVHRALAAARRDGTRAPESIYASGGSGEAKDNSGLLGATRREDSEGDGEP